MEFLITLSLWHFISLFLFGAVAEVVKKIASYYLMPKALEKFSIFLPLSIIVAGLVLGLIFPLSAEVILFGAVMSLVLYDTIVRAVKKTIREYKREQ